MPDEMFAYAEAGRGARAAGDHRRCRGSGAPAGDAGGQDDRAGARRPRGVAPSGGPGLAAIRSCRCPPASRSRRSPSARPAPTNAALFAVALLAADRRRARGRAARLPAPTPRRGGGSVLPPADAERHRADDDEPADPAAGDDRDDGWRSARPLRAHRRPHDGLRHARVDPDPSAPAGAVADAHLVAAYDDPARCSGSAIDCDVVTTEFENPPADCARAPGRHGPRGARRRRRCAIAQDRIAEKQFLVDNGFPSRRTGARRAGDHVDAESWRGRRRCGDRQDRPARLRRQGPAPRRRRCGDACGVGRAGRRAVRGRAALVDFDTEVSVIVARTADGRDRAVAGRREPARRRHPRPHGRAGAASGDDSPTGPSGSPSAIADALDYVGRAGGRDVRGRRRAARQRAGAAAAQQRALDARRRADQPVRAAGPRRVRRRARATRR